MQTGTTGCSHPDALRQHHAAPLGQTRQREAAQGQRGWDEKYEDVHALSPLCAFRMTVIELTDIAMAAASGVANPLTAMGTAIRL